MLLSMTQRPKEALRALIGAPWSPSDSRTEGTADFKTYVMRFATEKGVTKLVVCSIGKRRELENGRVFAPKGLYDSARGFNSGNRPKPHCALKGAGADRHKNLKVKCNRHSFQREHRRTNIVSVMEI
jgi:hypothetical protein